MRHSWDWITTDKIVSLFLPSRWSDKSIKTKQTTHAHMGIHISTHMLPLSLQGGRGERNNVIRDNKTFDAINEIQGLKR